VAANTFKLGLPMDFDLRKSLTMNPAWGMHCLMDRIEEHKLVEDDQIQGKGKPKVQAQELKDPWPDQYAPQGPRRNSLTKLLGRRWE